MSKDSLAIELHSISKTYTTNARPIKALKTIDLQIKCGEHIAIMGPSGSGKSTLLSIMGCLDYPDSGSYKSLGYDVLEFPPSELASFRNREIGFVFQNLSLLPQMNIQENVALPFEYSNKNRNEAISLARHALDQVGMLERAEFLPRQLSGGQQQRAAVARAIVNNPQLILADEPTGALDKESADELISLLVSLRSKQRTIIVVTHDPEIAKYADRIFLFQDGRFIE